MKNISGGSVKKDLEKFDIPEVKKIKDSSMSKIFDKIMNTPLCREFIDKYELTNKEIMDNFLPLLLVSENYEDINDHSNKVKGIVKKYNVKKTLSLDELFDLIKE